MIGESGVSYQEASLLLGLCLKQKTIDDSELNVDQIQPLISETRSLLDQLHRSYVKLVGNEMHDVMTEDGKTMSPNMTDEEREVSFKKIFGGRAAMIEAIFYSGSGAYDFQYMEMAPRLYRFDKAWLASRGLNLNHASIIYAAIKRLSNVFHYFYTNPEPDPANKIICAFDQFVFTKDMILDAVKALEEGIVITKDDIETFLEFFVAQPGEQYESLKAPGDLNIVHFKPIFKLSDTAYFLSLNFNLAEAVYKSPGYWMMQDADYIDTAAENRGKANEEITYEYFKKIFGNLAFKSLKIMKGRKTLTDIDVMGVIGNLAIVAQNKGKRMTIQSRQGDEKYLKKDFAGAIQDAYDQGLVSRKVILESKDYRFIDENGNEITLPQGIEQVYILCITADVYPAVLFQIETYLNKRNDDPWPLPLSLFDVDMLTEYLPDPYDFALYIKQRVDLTGIVQSDSEMTLLAYHLRQGLFKPERMDKFLVNSDLSQLVDADYMYRKGQIKEIDDKYSLKRDWSNATFEQLLSELKTNIDNPKLTDIIFFLKALPTDTADKFIEMMSKTREDSARDGLPHDISMPLFNDGKPWGGISYVTESNLSKLEQKLAYLVKINKYRHKPDDWFGLGSLIGQSSLVNCALFTWGEWEQSGDMDRLLEYTMKTSKGYLMKFEKPNQVQTPKAQKPDKKTKLSKKRIRKARRKAQRKGRKK